MSDNGQVDSALARRVTGDVLQTLVDETNKAAAEVRPPLVVPVLRFLLYLWGTKEINTPVELYDALRQQANCNNVLYDTEKMLFLMCDAYQCDKVPSTMKVAESPTTTADSENGLRETIMHAKDWLRERLPQQLSLNPWQEVAWKE